jgi:hypothetical protein
MKHQTNKAERRLIAVKKKKRVKTVRTIDVSPENINSAVESFLFSMRMIDADDKVIAVSTEGTIFSVSLEKQEEVLN